MCKNLRTARLNTFLLMAFFCERNFLEDTLFDGLSLQRTVDIDIPRISLKMFREWLGVYAA